MANPPDTSADVLAPQEAALAIAAAEGRAGNAGGSLSATLGAATEGAARGVAYKWLKQTHPSYDAPYYKRLRALYEGGKKLLGDGKLMRVIFPQHRNELPTLYEERQGRAFYTPYAAEIIGHIVAGLAAEPLEMSLGSDTEEGQADLPEYYARIQQDMSPRGGRKQGLNELVKDQIRTALILRCGWTLVELPSNRDEQTGEVRVYGSEGEQEKGGALDAYAVSLEPEAVIDWEEEESGELLWAILHTASQRRKGIASGRGMVKRTWTYYDRQIWARFEIEHKVDSEPKEEDLIPLVATGVHTFGRVPLLRLELPEGLWAMDKLEGLQRAHFNKRNALDWGELQSLLPELYEFLGPEGGASGTRIGVAQEDPGRAVTGLRGQGFVQVRGSDDKAEFVGPDSAPFAQAAASCDSLRDDMHRVMHQMALSLDNSAASVGRSAESKAQDKAAVAAILTELGMQARKHADAIFQMISGVRQEPDLAEKWAASGMAKFDAVAVADAIEQALSIDMLHIESATFRKRHRQGLARAILGDEATDEDLEAIDKELEENITDESVEQIPERERMELEKPPVPLVVGKPKKGTPPQGMGR